MTDQLVVMPGAAAIAGKADYKQSLDIKFRAIREHVEKYQGNPVCMVSLIQMPGAFFNMPMVTADVGMSQRDVADFLEKVVTLIRERQAKLAGG